MPAAPFPCACGPPRPPRNGSQFQVSFLRPTGSDPAVDLGGAWGCVWGAGFSSPRRSGPSFPNARAGLERASVSPGCPLRVSAGPDASETIYIIYKIIFQRRPEFLVK